MARPTPGARLAGVAAFVLLVEMALVAVASTADWPSQADSGVSGASRVPQGADWVLLGSAVSVGWREWGLVVVAGTLALLARLTHYLLSLAAAAVALVAAAGITRAGLAEALAVGPLTVPREVLWTSAVASGGLALSLAWAALHELVVAIRIRWPREDPGLVHLLPE